MASRNSDLPIQNCQELFSMNDNALQALTKHELIRCIVNLRPQYLTTTTTLSETDGNGNIQGENINNQQIWQQLLEQSKNQTKLLTNINNTLTNLTNPTALVKFSLLLLFLWTTCRL